MRLLTSAAVILGLWQLIVVVFDMPSFILPSPIEVLDRLITRYDVLLKHTWVTAQEILLASHSAYRWVAIRFANADVRAAQTLAIADSYRQPSNSSICYRASAHALAGLRHCIESSNGGDHHLFPVTTCCYDGLRNTPTGYLDLAKTMGASKWQLLRHIQLPAALPTLASGIRVAVVIAPIGAVVGEWVGSSEGLLI